MGRGCSSDLDPGESRVLWRPRICREIPAQKRLFMGQEPPPRHRLGAWLHQPAASKGPAPGSQGSLI